MMLVIKCLYRFVKDTKPINAAFTRPEIAIMYIYQFRVNNMQFDVPGDFFKEYECILTLVT